MAGNLTPRGRTRRGSNQLPLSHVGTLSRKSTVDVRGEILERRHAQYDVDQRLAPSPAE